MSKSLFKSTSVVSAMTMISRVLGFVRDAMAAQIFGVNASVDAFTIAFKIPNFLRNLFAEGSFSQAFVPVLSEYRQKQSPEEVKNFINHIGGALGSVLLILTILGMLAAPLITKLFAPGLDPYRFHLATEMLRITFPYLLFISLTAFAGSILNSYGAFGVPSITPALLNISLIATAIWLSSHLAIPVESQAWGVFAAGVIQLLFQLPFLRRLGFLPRPRLNWRDKGVQRVLKLMVPSLFGASITQISILLNTIFASFLVTGSVTWLYYSERLAYFPLGVFGVALATVVLPHLSRKHADQNPKHFMNALDWGIRCNLIIGLPATIVLFFIAGPIITTLFQGGKFTAYDVLMTRQSVIAYAVGLQAFMLVKVLSSGFYAQQNIRTPVRIAIMTVIFTMILNAALIYPLKHAGLALATSLSAWFNAILLYVTLYRKNIYRLQPGWSVYFLRLFIANSAVAFVLWIGEKPLEQWFAWRWYDRVEHLFLLMMLAIFIYFVSLWMTGLRLKHFRVQET